MPDLIAAVHLAAEAIEPVLPEWHVSEGMLYAITLKGRDEPAQVRVFREFMRKRFEAFVRYASGR